jgi:hypothetical protein
MTEKRTEPDRENTKKKKEDERKLVRRLVDGLAAWVTFKQAANAKTLYSEYFLYPAMYEIASGRGWSVLAQEPITKSSPKSGAPSTVDFVFYRNSRGSRPGGMILLEVKYLRGVNVSQELGGLQDDFEKLQNLTSDHLRHATSLSDCGYPERWQIVIVQRNHYNKLAKSGSKKFSRLVAMLARASSKKLPRSMYRSIIETKLKSELHWHVFAFGQRVWP